MYGIDHREAAAQRQNRQRDIVSFDEARMMLVYRLEDDDGVEETVELPATFEVCGVCDGKGMHVNPAIDGRGISPLEFDEDPDFAESYFTGLYDVTCYECHGQRVVPEIDRGAANSEAVERVETHLAALAQADHEWNLEIAAERRMAGI